MIKFNESTIYRIKTKIKYSCMFFLLLLSFTGCFRNGEIHKSIDPISKSEMVKIKVPLKTDYESQSINPYLSLRPSGDNIFISKISLTFMGHGIWSFPSERNAHYRVDLKINNKSHKLKVIYAGDNNYTVCNDYGSFKSPTQIEDFNFTLKIEKKLLEDIVKAHNVSFIVYFESNKNDKKSYVEEELVLEKTEIELLKKYLNNF